MEVFELWQRYYAKILYQALLLATLCGYRYLQSWHSSCALRLSRHLQTLTQILRSHSILKVLSSG